VFVIFAGEVECRVVDRRKEPTVFHAWPTVDYICFVRTPVAALLTTLRRFISGVDVRILNSSYKFLYPIGDEISSLLTRTARFGSYFFISA
jgi:hypothetical protein